MDKRNNHQAHRDYLVRILFIVMALFSLPSLLNAQVSANNYATGNVSGRNYVGGLTGRIADQEGVVSNSYSRGNVTGATRAGGLAGSNSGTVKNSYSTGRVTGTANAGGLVGWGSGSVTGSYWDIQTSAQTTSAGGTGRNSDPMTWPYASDTYLGWDFTTLWKADQTPYQNNGYPLLSSLDLFRVTVQVYPPGSGTVSGEGFYPSGQMALLETTADNRYVFKGWLNNSEVVGTSPQLSLKVAGHTSLVARFESKTTAVVPGLSKKIPGFILYPNPVKEILYVDLSALPDKPVSVAVARLTGQTMILINPLQQGVTELAVRVSGLAPGMYLIIVQHSSGIISERFVKQ